MRGSRDIFLKYLLQSETYVRSNNNKKTIKQTYLPAEEPESNSDEDEAGDAECSVHHLSSGVF